MKRRIYLIISFAFLLILGACSEDTAMEQNIGDLKQLIEQYSLGNVDSDVALASVTSEELIITMENDEQEVHQLPEDEFFVSIAPYENVTHPCANHSLTTCQGEMVETEFAVQIENADGAIIIEDKMMTMENGFIDLWLPRDENFTITVEYDGNVAKKDISTFQGDDTCITTMQLDS